MAINLDALILSLIVNVIFVSPVLWLSGKILVGGENAKFVDALIITIFGIVIGVFVESFFAGIIAIIVQFSIWLLTIRRFFDCSWLTAMTISILAIIIFIVIGVVLNVIGFTFWRVI